MAHVNTLDASLAIGAVAIVDGAAPDYGLLKDRLEERIQSIPRCTQLLRTQNFEWIDGPEFDLTRHVRRVAIPRPGDDAGLSLAIAHALERPLDLDRPPWECWVIEGLKGNRWAILMKVHHGLADGNSAAHLLTRLCDDADGDMFTNHIGGEHVSAPPAQKPPAWADALERAAALAGTLVGAMWPAARHSVDPVTAIMRRYATVRVPIADVDSVCRKFGVTVNDVALAAITEGFRSVLLRRGEEPRADSLRTLVPMPVRSAMLPFLPVEHDDPVQRLRIVHNRWKVRQADQPSGGIVESAINCLPTVLRSNLIQLLARLPQRGIVTLATNAPGPRHQLRLMGQTLERLLPIPPTASQLSTGVAVLSYGDEVVFGITTEYDAAADVKQLTAGIELGMARLVALSQDSVLLFSKDHRRKRAVRAAPNRMQRARPSAPAPARH
jgi:diacylglycerol O-acyltransferase / wax synthase